MTVLDACAGILGRVADTGQLISRYGLRLDTNPVPAEWSHITKVDPEYRRKLPIAFPLYLVHTDAISVGGSSDVTPENTVNTFAILDYTSTPAFHEPSDAHHVTRESQSQAEFLAVPQVLNGDDEAFIGTYGRGVEYVREEMAPELLEKLPPLPHNVTSRITAILTGIILSNSVTEAYIVQNPDSAAARESGVMAKDIVAPETARQRGMAAEYVLGSEIIYLEYSGIFGNDEATDILEALSDGTDWSRVWYGGGIDSGEKSAAVLGAGADAVVVGDVFHRIAEEEAKFVEAYGKDVAAVSGTPSDVTTWLDNNVDVANTAASSYLSTIPSVLDPVTEARRCLASGLRAGRALIEERERIPDDGPLRIDSATVETIAQTIGIGTDDPEKFANQLVAAMVHDDDKEFPTEKLVFESS